MNLVKCGCVFLLLLIVSCSPQNQKSDHPLLGAWHATDGTVFIFREDGTFHGIDFRMREIWGNWVELSAGRIGFQTLLHDSFYRPQYALIDSENKDVMHYIVTGGNHFISAKRIPIQQAVDTVKTVTAPQIHLPDNPKPPYPPESMYRD